MGFMSQFGQQPQQQVNNPLNMLSAAQKIVGNDPRAALQQMADNGMTCNLPNGSTVSVADLMKAAEGKTAAQFLAEIMK